ncbi:MAG: Nre family DNA repair protein [Thermoproteus sp.]
MYSICAKCQGRKMLCGLPRCPIVERINAVKSSLFRIRGREIFGATPPSAVVGEAGWPRVRVYIGEPPEVTGDAARAYDDPRLLWGKDLEEIIRLRSYMAFGFRQTSRPWELGELPLLAVSERPVDVEMRLAKDPVQTIKFDLREKPMGPRAPLDGVRIDGNPAVPRALERAMADDLQAGEAAVELYRRGVDLYTIQRAFALGLLGARHRRRLVPTRWSITAVDVAVGDSIADRVRQMPEVAQTLYGYAEYLDNRYLVVVAPGPLRFFYLERWIYGGRAAEIEVVEDPRGRRSTMDGGYEAARLAVLEKLASMGRKGTVSIVRRIGERYYVSVGNWQIRETLRRLQLRPLDEDYRKYVQLVERDPLSLIRTPKRLDEFL